MSFRYIPCARPRIVFTRRTEQNARTIRRVVYIKFFGVLQQDTQCIRSANLSDGAGECAPCLRCISCFMLHHITPACSMSSARERQLNMNSVANVCARWRRGRCRARAAAGICRHCGLCETETHIEGAQICIEGDLCRCARGLKCNLNNLTIHDISIVVLSDPTAVSEFVSNIFR